MKRMLSSALLLAAGALVPGCGFHGPSNDLPGTATFGAPNLAAAHQSSPVSGDLLYVSSVTDKAGNEAAAVYTYPQGRRVRLKPRLTGPLVYGDCADTKGNVYVVEELLGSPANLIDEFPHGKLKPIGTYFGVYSASETQCSVDPTSGYLAATGPSVYVYPYPDRSKILTYTLPGVGARTCTYDEQGNLYVIGRSSNHDALFELAKGSSSFVSITLPAMHGFKNGPGAIRWDGKYLAYANTEHTVYRLAISGETAKIAGRTHLRDTEQIGNIWIQRDTIVAAASGSRVLIWNYPSGGKPIGAITLKGSSSLNVGVAVSVPSPRP